MGVAGVVILYHPDDDVSQNIESYLPYLDKLYVADNTEDQMSALAARLWKTDKIQVLYDSMNEGIAKRLNDAAKLAIGEGFNWLLTMDQDSKFEGSSAQDYLLCAGSYFYKNKVAVFGVEYENKQEHLIHCTPVARTKLITSGSLINLNLFTEVGGFNELLFIDEVDFDYCYRARLKQYEVIQYQNIFMSHTLGKSTYHRSLKNLQTTHRSLHSPARMYYMTRNFLYVNKHYKQHFPEDIAVSKQGLLNRIKNNLLYNNKRFYIIAAVVRGVRDYLVNKY